MSPDPQSFGPADAIAQGRTTLLKRAHTLLGEPNPSSPPARDVLPEVTGLLSASLEELKIAEEELRFQNDRITASFASELAERQRFTEMFRQHPIPTLLTDSQPTVLHCNAAAARLLRLEPARCDRKPLSAFVHLAARASFREQVTRLALIDGATRFSLVLQPRGDVPIRIGATVTSFNEPGVTHRRFYWIFDPTPASAAQDSTHSVN